MHYCPNCFTKLHWFFSVAFLKNIYYCPNPKCETYGKETKK